MKFNNRLKFKFLIIVKNKIAKKIFYQKINYKLIIKFKIYKMKQIKLMIKKKI